MANVCCEYKVARRGMLVTNLLVVLFSFIFIGVVTLFWLDGCLDLDRI